MQIQLTDRNNAPPRPSLDGLRRFKLTALFLVISALTFAGVATAINYTSEQSEETNILTMTTEQSEKDAKLIAGIVVKTLANEQNSDASPAAQETSATELSVADFLRSSNIVRLSLYDLEGNNTWSSTSDKRSVDLIEAEEFHQAVAGSISSDLSKNALVFDSSGVGYNADVVETFIPFMDSDQGVPVSVLGVTRNVTNALAARVGETSSSIFRTMMISLGIAFAILFATVLGADRHIWKQRIRSIQYEREIASQELTAARQEVENRALQETNEERAKFLSTVSHELKTPLTSMLGFTEVIARHQDGPDKETNLEQLEIVKRNGKHLLSLINDLLDSGELQTGGVALEREQFSIDESLQTMRETMTPLVESKNQHLEIAATLDNTHVRLDRRRIDQVLMNLVGNASKYSPNGTAIRVEAKGTATDLQLIVEDHGIGISTEDQRRLFTKFFRVDNEATRRVGGTGLGLAITKEIVEAHGGTIDLWSKPGEGSRITVTLPDSILAHEPLRTPQEDTPAFEYPVDYPGDYPEIEPEAEHIRPIHRVIWGSAPRHGGYALEPAIGKLAAVQRAQRKTADPRLPIEY